MKTTHQINVHHKLNCLHILHLHITSNKHSSITNQHINWTRLINCSFHRFKIANIGTKCRNFNPDRETKENTDCADLDLDGVERNLDGVERDLDGVEIKSNNLDQI